MDYNKAILDEIARQLIDKKQTVAVAESVTSGHLQAALSNAKDAACFFQGGITVYNLGQKCRHLEVEPVHALECNCVSETVSSQMAKQVANKFLSDYGLAITGYATPVPEKNIKKLFAYLCVSRHGEIVLTRKLDPGDRTAYDAQVFFTNEVLAAFHEILS